MKKRRLFARICALLMVCVILSPFVPASYAADGDDITQDQAVEYIRSLEGLCIDVDDGEYTDVDLAMQYFKEVGGRIYMWRHGCVLLCRSHIRRCHS